MTDEQINLLLEIGQRSMAALERIAVVLERHTPPTSNAPSYTFPLESFASFDWESIGASVERTDNYGAAIVSWQGNNFVRRSPNNKFGEAIFFSRCVGKDEQGENKYERLISFKSIPQAEPLPEKVLRKLSS